MKIIYSVLLFFIMLSSSAQSKINFIPDTFSKNYYAYIEKDSVFDNIYISNKLVKFKDSLVCEQGEIISFKIKRRNITINATESNGKIIFHLFDLNGDKYIFRVFIISKVYCVEQMQSRKITFNQNETYPPLLYSFYNFNLILKKDNEYIHSTIIPYEILLYLYKLKPGIYSLIAGSDVIQITVINE